MKKRIILFISLLILIVSIAVLPVNAYSSDIGNNYYSSIYFKYVEINDRYITEDDTVFTWDGNEMTNTNIINIDNTVFLEKNFNYLEDYNFVTIYASITDGPTNQPITQIEYYTDVIFIDSRTDHIEFYTGYSFDIEISFTLIKNGIQEEKIINDNSQNYYSLIHMIQNNINNGQPTGTLQLRNLKIKISGLSSVLNVARKTTRQLNNDYIKINNWYEEQGLLTPIIIESISEEDTTNFMAWVGAIFSAVGGFFNIKLGDTTIGAILLIPLMLSIIFVILKIWRGGSA